MSCNTKIISTHLAKSERITNLNILPMELIGISQQKGRVTSLPVLSCDVSPSVNKFILIVITIHLYFNIKHVACQCACCALCFLFSNLLFFRTNKIFNGWCTVLTLLTNGCGCKLLFIFRSGLLNLSFKFFLSLLWWCRGRPHFGLNIDSLPVWSRDIPDTPEPFLMTASSKFT